MLISSQLKLAGTKSFRLSSAMLFGRYGVNLQNPIDELMRCVVPKKGYIFVQCDQSGAEALVVAYLTKPGRFRELFHYGIKPHTYMALQIFLDKFRGNFPRSRYEYVEPKTLAAYPEWPELAKAIASSKREYLIGKKLIHALDYDVKWPTFRLSILEETDGQVILSPKETKYYFTCHKGLFPEIPEWQAQLIDEVRKSREVRNLFRYPRRFVQPWSSEVEREVLSFIPQSTVGCITHHAVVHMQRFIEANGLLWDILNNKHDSYLLQCPITESAVCSQKAKEFMEQDLTAPSGERFQMKAEVSTGFNWGHYAPDNTDGLK